MLNKHKRRLRNVVLLFLTAYILYFFGIFTHLMEKDFNTDFHYPYDDDIRPFIEKLRNNETPTVKPLNVYKFNYLKNGYSKCENVSVLRLVYLVKSAPENFNRRIAIRSSWGFERRFSDVNLKTVFLVGTRNSVALQKALDEESHRFQDVIQADFTDSYFNNTYKTMMGFDWITHFCPTSEFYMFVDDDYYISTKNILRFIRNPVEYPKYLEQSLNNRKLLQNHVQLENKLVLFAGYVFKSAPHRHFISKWYISLEEYPYHLWPPYVTAGAYLLSNEALKIMYYASLYTKHFKFDDIYLGLVAFKANIEPFHCDRFYFYKKNYSPQSYKFVIASHGFDNYRELVSVWTEQRSLGNA